MTFRKSALLAGLSAFTLAGTAGLAIAHAPARMHTMTVKTPDGGIATIEYSGNVAPTVRFGTAPRTIRFFGGNTPFAAFDNISAQMNREMDVLLRQAQLLQVPFANQGSLFSATLNGAPGAQSHAWFAGAGNNSFCMRSVEITQSGNSKPHVVSHTAGNCAGANGLNGAVAHSRPRNGHGMLMPAGPAQQPDRLPVEHEVHYTPQ